MPDKKLENMTKAELIELIESLRGEVSEIAKNAEEGPITLRKN